MESFFFSLCSSNLIHLWKTYLTLFNILLYFLHFICQAQIKTKLYFFLPLQETNETVTMIENYSAMERHVVCFIILNMLWNSTNHYCDIKNIILNCFLFDFLCPGSDELCYQLERTSSWNKIHFFYLQPKKMFTT